MDGGSSWFVGKNIKKVQRADEGSASRFFYCAKTNKTDRNEGADNVHPTVKPTDLMRYLVRMVTPPNGTVLDPFMGSGSTGKASMLEGFKFIGIDMTAEYMDIAEARIEYAYANKNAPQKPQGSPSLFKSGFLEAQVPANSPFFLKIIFTAIPANANPNNAIANKISLKVAILNFFSKLSLRD